MARVSGRERAESAAAAASRYLVRGAAPGAAATPLQRSAPAQCECYTVAMVGKWFYLKHSFYFLQLLYECQNESTILPATVSERLSLYDVIYYIDNLFIESQSLSVWTGVV